MLKKTQGLIKSGVDDGLFARRRLISKITSLVHARVAQPSLVNFGFAATILSTQLFADVFQFWEPPRIATQKSTPRCFCQANAASLKIYYFSFLVDDKHVTSLSYFVSSRLSTREIALNEIWHRTFNGRVYTVALELVTGFCGLLFDVDD